MLILHSVNYFAYNGTYSRWETDAHERAAHEERCQKGIKIGSRIRWVFLEEKKKIHVGFVAMCALRVGPDAQNKKRALLENNWTGHYHTWNGRRRPIWTFHSNTSNSILIQIYDCYYHYDCDYGKRSCDVSHWWRTHRTGLMIKTIAAIRLLNGCLWWTCAKFDGSCWIMTWHLLVMMCQLPLFRPSVISKPLTIQSFINAHFTEIVYH